MAFDGLFLNRILTELEEDLIDAKINRVHQPDERTLTLKLNSHRRGNCMLLLSAHPQNARLQLSEARYENPAKPPLFAMVLRKYVEGGRIVSLSQAGLDRVAAIEIDARDEIGDRHRFHLIVEIMAKHSNVILCDENMTILAAIKPYGNAVSRYRRVLPGESYVAPPPSGKDNPLLLTEEEFADRLLENDLDLSLKQSLLQKIEGISPATAAELLYRSGIPADFALEEAGSHEFRRLFREIRSLIEADSRPTLSRGGGKTLDFYFQPLRHYEGEEISCSDLNSLLDAYFGAKEEENRFASKKASLLKIVSRFRDKSSRTVAKQRKELAAAVGGEKYRLYGEVLSANLYRVEDHSESVTLENFYENNKPLTIPLKKELTASENAGRYFKRYNKAKQSKNAIREHLERNEAEHSYLESICYEIEAAAGEEELSEIFKELKQSGYLKEKRDKKREKQIKPLSPIEVSCLGHTVLIGRNNRQNDKLTLRIAQKDDLWLHAKDIPGSHVIIRRGEKGEIPEEVIVRAAAFAAYHSKAKDAAKVPVDCTEVRHVKKPNGARPGMVIYFEQTTIMAVPEKERDESESEAGSTPD